MLEFKNLKELQKYYNKNSNTYIFTEDVKFEFDLDIDSHIIAKTILAWDIKTKDIHAHNIIAFSIDAENIYYYGVCVAYEEFTCTSIEGSYKNPKHLSLNDKLRIRPKLAKSVRLELTEDELKKLKQLLKEEIS